MHVVLVAALLTLLQSSPPGTIGGTVIDTSGSTVPNATVQLEDAGLVVSETQTGADGRFVVTLTATDGMRLIVIAPGFARRIVPVTRESGPLTIELAPAPFFDAIQVTSSRGTDAHADPTVTASVFQAADVLSGPALAVDDALKIVPGFTLFPSSRVANPTMQTMVLRGLGGSGVSRSLVLADGVPLNDAFGGWVYWDKVPHAAIDRIEVLRGGGSDLYGADAVGGVVQILTLAPSAPMARVLIEGGSLETGRVSAFGGGRTGPWSMSGGGQWFTTAGYILVAPDERGAIDRPSGSTHRTAMASMHYAATSWRFGLRASVFSEDRTNGTVLQTNDTNARLASAEAMGAVAGGFLSLRAFGGTQGYDQTFSVIEAEPPRSGEYLALVQRVPSRHGGASAQWFWQRNVTDLLIGGDARLVDGHTVDTRYEPGLPPAIVDTGGSGKLGSAFVRATVAINGRVTLAVGAHADAWRSASRRSSFEQTVGAVSPRLSLAYRLDDHLAIRGSVFGGFRAPTLNELHRTFQVGNDLTVGNDALTPERLKAAEAGVTYSRGPASLRVTGFWSALSDAVTSVTVATSPTLNTRRRENAGRIRSAGLEFEGDVRLSPSLSVVVSSALIDSRFKGRTALRDYRVPQVADYSVAGILRYRDRLWTASAQFRVTGPQFDDDVNTRAIGRATEVDVFGGRTLARRVMAFVAVENLLDSEYDVGRIPVRIVGLPRAVRGGIQVLFP